MVIREREGGNNGSDNHKHSRERHQRDKAEERENYLILKSIDAVGKLTYANAVAIRDGKTNGEMHDAMESYNETKQEMYEYLLEQNSKN